MDRKSTDERAGDMGVPAGLFRKMRRPLDVRGVVDYISTMTSATQTTTPAFDEPACALCGGALIPGLNTDFCSLACEEAWRATQPDDLDAPDINGQE